MAKPKKFVVGGVEYRVTVGGTLVKISRPGFATHAPNIGEVIGGYNHDGEDYPVLPSDVASWIRRNAWRFTMKKGEKVLRLRLPNYDTVLDYKGYGGCEAFCGIKIWVIGGGAGSALPHRYVVVMTQLEENKGTSVTNASEIIATTVLRDLLPKADPDIITWIEHYPPRGDVRDRMPETYDLVMLRYDGDKFQMDRRDGQHPWKHLVEKDLKELGILW